MAEAMIQARGLSIGYGRKVLQAPLDFEVERGRIFMILGGSGCGKSTLLRHMIGLERTLGGELLVAGEPPMSGAGRRPRFGVMFQSGALFGSMTLAENIRLPLETWSTLDPESIDVLVRWKLRLVGLDGFENHLPAELSGGMKKRAGIARALALDPDLLFLDEPSAGLDPVSAAELDELLLTLNRSLGMTIVIVTHELASILHIGQRCIMLDRNAGGIIARGVPRELAESATEPGVRAFFDRQPARRASAAPAPAPGGKK